MFRSLRFLFAALAGKRLRGGGGDRELRAPSARLGARARFSRERRRPLPAADVAGALTARRRAAGTLGGAARDRCRADPAREAGGAVRLRSLVHSPRADADNQAAREAGGWTDRVAASA